ncbi:MAG: hypothetical protein ABIY55_00735, partial [Kofleriaceae bacterium]
MLVLVGCGGGTPSETSDGGIPGPDAAVADARPDSADGAPGADAAVPDAPPDAAPDAPPAPDVTIALAPPPVFTNHGPAQAVFATATNHTAGELAMSVTVAGDVTLVADGA